MCSCYILDAVIQVNELDSLFASTFIDFSDLGGAFYMFLWRCHKDVVEAFHRYYLFCLERQKMFGNSFNFRMSSINFFWNVSFTNRNLMFCITSKNSFSNASICLHCGGVFFDLNLKSSLQISLSWFSCKKKRTLQCIHFTTLSIFSITLIRYGSLDGDQL